jgi:lipopolysaccharide transport system ATP-binding protein
VANEGRTVLFVSHNMIAIQSLCKRALWLDGGTIADDSNAGTVVRNYLSHSFGNTNSEEEIWPIETAPGNDSVRLHRVQVRSLDEVSGQHLTTRTPFCIDVEYWNLQPGANINITLHLYTEQQVIAFTTGSGSGDPEWARRSSPAGLFRSTCYVPGDLLNVGRHRFNVLVIKDLSSVIYQYESGVTFEIFDLDERVLSQYAREPGVVKPALKWKMEQVGEL